jgi:topoisomerase-4 subunit A
MYSVIDAPDKLFVDKGMLHCGFVDKELVFNVVYREEETIFPYLKRFTLEHFILNKAYSLVPEKCTILKLTLDSDSIIIVDYKPKPRLKVLEETFIIKDFLVKGVKASGVRLANKELKSVKITGG